jgi:hypothetical protein
MKDLGPTSRFPRGKFLKDRLELGMALGAERNTITGKWTTMLYIEFSFPVARIALDKAEATTMAKILFKNTEDLPKSKIPPTGDGEPRLSLSIFRDDGVVSTVAKADVAANLVEKTVVINFPDWVGAIGVEKADAEELARMLLSKAEEL